MLAVWCLAASIVAPAAGGDGGAPSARSAEAPGVIIRKVYRYRDAGLFKPEAGRQFVAVDIEFRGFADLDLDDVEIIDAATDETLDAGPEAAFLRPDGGFYSWHRAPEHGPMRTLLIFGVPERVKAIQLQYWGDRLTRGPLAVAPSGPTLPELRPGAE